MIVKIFFILINLYFFFLDSISNKLVNRYLNKMARMDTQMQNNSIINNRLLIIKLRYTQI